MSNTPGERVVLALLRNTQKEPPSYDGVFRVWVDRFRRPTDAYKFESTITQLAKEGKVQLAMLDGLITLCEHRPEAPRHEVRFASRAPERLMW